MKKDPVHVDLTLADQMGVALKHAGVSITITTITDVFAFGVGAFSVRFSIIVNQPYLIFFFARKCLVCNLSVLSQPWHWVPYICFRLLGLLPSFLSMKNALNPIEMAACLVLSTLM